MANADVLERREDHVALVLAGRRGASRTPARRGRGRTRSHERSIAVGGVDPDRGTKTWAEVVLRIDRPRWRKPRVVLRAGKALAQRREGVLVRFRPVEGRRRTPTSTTRASGCGSTSMAPTTSTRSRQANARAAGAQRRARTRGPAAVRARVNVRVRGRRAPLRWKSAGGPCRRGRGVTAGARPGRGVMVARRGLARRIPGRLQRAASLEPRQLQRYAAPPSLSRTSARRSSGSTRIAISPPGPRGHSAGGRSTMSSRPLPSRSRR
jgi:glucose-6-phosphate dehydrogenase-like protein